MPAALLIGFAFAAVGMAATTWVRSWTDFDYIFVITLPLFLFSSTFFPLSVYPEPLRTLIALTPLSRSIDLVRSLSLGDIEPSPAGRHRLPAGHGRDRPVGRLAPARQAPPEVAPLPMDRPSPVDRAALAELEAEIVACRRCPRLVEWRERVAREKVARYADEPYWGRPLPGFGDPEARVLIVGLAPAAHGGNRTGRVFTGDRSGDFLWTALHETGFADRASSRRADDGLALTDAWIAAAVRCAPPLNKPTNAERDTCAPVPGPRAGPAEQRPGDRAARRIRLGGGPADDRCAWAIQCPRPKPRFGHGAEVEIGPYRLVASFHPSQQNTFTGRLTGPMLADVMARAAALADGPDRPTLMAT